MVGEKSAQPIIKGWCQNVWMCQCKCERNYETFSIVFERNETLVFRSLKLIYQSKNFSAFHHLCQKCLFFSHKKVYHILYVLFCHQKTPTFTMSIQYRHWRILTALL